MARKKAPAKKAPAKKAPGLRARSAPVAATAAAGLPPDDDTPPDAGPGQIDSVVIDPLTNELVPRDPGEIGLVELVVVLLSIGEVLLAIKVF